MYCNYRKDQTDYPKCSSYITTLPHCKSRSSDNPGYKSPPLSFSEFTIKRRVQRSLNERIGPISYVIIRKGIQEPRCQNYQTTFLPTFKPTPISHLSKTGPHERRYIPGTRDHRYNESKKPRIYLLLEKR